MTGCVTLAGWLQTDIGLAAVRISKTSTHKPRTVLTLPLHAFLFFFFPLSTKRIFRQHPLARQLSLVAAVDCKVQPRSLGWIPVGCRLSRIHIQRRRQRSSHHNASPFSAHSSVFVLAAHPSPIRSLPPFITTTTWTPATLPPTLLRRLLQRY